MRSHQLSISKWMDRLQVDVVTNRLPIKPVPAYMQEAEFLRHFIHQAPILIWSVTPDGISTFANAAVEELTGLSAQAIVGRPALKILAHYARPCEMRSLLNRFEISGNRLKNDELALRDAAGRPRLLSWSTVDRLDEAGRLLEIVAFGSDITVNRQAEEERYRLVIQGANDGIWDWDIQNDQLYFNDRLLEILEMPVHSRFSTQFNIQAFADLMHPDDRVRVLNQINAHLSDPSSKYKVECRLRKRSGDYCYCIAKGEATRNKEGEPVRMAGLISDITEQKLMEEALHGAHQELVAVNEQLSRELHEREKLESQLVQAQKMESIGQLAAGIAHEINNPIGFVQSNMVTLQEYVQILKRLMLLYGQVMALMPEPVDTSPEKALLEEIHQVAETENLSYILEDADSLVLECQDGLNRMKEIVQGLKTFARMDESDLKETDINECLESTLKIVWNELKYKCVVHKMLNPLPPVLCHPGQLNQVFMNLLVNAAQAIREKGEIRIRTVADSTQVQIEISDTGMGIEPANLKNIFNPFFTTKPVGQGTGLGLSISYGIIQKHGGKIEVESKVHIGTTFRILLPLGGPVHASSQSVADSHAEIAS